MSLSESETGPPAAAVRGTAPSHAAQAAQNTISKRPCGEPAGQRAIRPHCVPPEGPYTNSLQALRAQMRSNAINPTDKHVGSRVRMRRLMLDMSQTYVADALGLTFQQV